MTASPSQPAVRFILGSRSPRRLELLKAVVPPDRVEVVPPRSVDEPGFDGLTGASAVEERLLEIARSKCADVLAQISARPAVSSGAGQTAVITADTVVIAHDPQGHALALAQPPEDETWPAVVRSWFLNYYLGQTITAATAVCVALVGGARLERVVGTEVSFDSQAASLLEWYLMTGEPRGRAGGFAIQGAGGIFVSRVTGSLSNVIGLPLRELLEMFDELRIM